MSSFGTLYSYPGNPRAAKIHAVANLSGLSITDGPFTMGETNRSDDFLSKFPLGKVPAFTSADGLNLFESGAIATFVAENGSAKDQLLGSTPAERALVKQWIDLAENELTTHSMTCLIPRLGYRKFDEGAEGFAIQCMERVLALLEKHLSSGRKFVATESLSLADITIAQSLTWGFKLVLDAEVRAKYPAVVEYFKRVVASDGVKEAFGEPEFVEKRSVPQ
ncbi:glutathione S-transferase [Aspergillus pseudodeflectus]|uniref:Glutathione S-transferase n=1 Tax=Aspergillus pseudodeflectus TaxID=176178 RepID=A0ABR4JDC9_9EURO